MNVGRFKKRLAEIRDDIPVVVLLTDPESETTYLKAYARSLSLVHDHLPDEDGSDDLHNSATVVVIEAVLGKEPPS